MLRLFIKVDIKEDLYAISPLCAGAFAVLSISSDMVYNVGINLKCNYGSKVYGVTIHMVDKYIVSILLRCQAYHEVSRVLILF